MPRQPNAVDFWRGFALVTIFINHVPGLWYSNFTYGNVSISDSADLFVFLAGWSVRLLSGRGDRVMPTRDLVLRLGGRVVELYAAQVMITMLAVALLAATATLLNNPLLLEWHNAAAVFNDPVPTHIGLAVLTHQLGYFDILPLYVVLIMMAPLFVLIDRFAPNLVLPVSITLYLVVIGFQITVPTWPVPGRWFFNPLSWQLIFVLGFVLAKDDAGAGAWVRRHIFTIRSIAIPLVIFLGFVLYFDWWYDPTSVPRPRLFFLLDKSFATPIRLIQFLSLVAAFSLAFPYIKRLGEQRLSGWLVAPLIRLLSMLGRNSLYVFCLGSLLSLSAQVVRYFLRGSVGVDTAVVIVGIGIMAFTAWLAELRQSRKTSAPVRA